MKFSQIDKRGFPEMPFNIKVSNNPAASIPLPTKLTHRKLTNEIMVKEYGFEQQDWFYNKGAFSVGFLFRDIFLQDKNADYEKVDIFYGDTKLYKIPLFFCHELEFIYKLITGNKLKKSNENIHR